MTTNEIRVADIMTRDVYTLAPTQSLPLAESLMRRFRLRHLPIVEPGGRVVGILSERDLLAAKISALAPLSDDERSTIQLSVPVSRVARTPRIANASRGWSTTTLTSIPTGAMPRVPTRGDRSPARATARGGDLKLSPLPNPLVVAMVMSSTGCARRTQ